MHITDEVDDALDPQAKGPEWVRIRLHRGSVTAGISLAGKTVLVTGSNSGLGLETVRVLGMRGAQLIATARTAEKVLRLRFFGSLGVSAEAAVHGRTLL